MDVGKRRIAGKVHRIVPSRFPPVSVFDSIARPEDLELLLDLESQTNERLLQEVGRISLVAPEDRVAGPGTTPIMAAFTHPNIAGSRFSDGSYGVYYCAEDEETAIIESAFHRARILREANLPPTYVEMRRYVCRLQRPMALVPKAQQAAILDPDSYAESQAFGRKLKEANAWGISYSSVRARAPARCVAVLRPPALTPVTQTSHYRYRWDGSAISRIEPYEVMTVVSS